MLYDETPMDEVLFEQAGVQGQAAGDEDDELAEEWREQQSLEDAEARHAEAHRAPLVGGSLPSPLADSQPTDGGQG